MRFVLCPILIASILSTALGREAKSEKDQSSTESKALEKLIAQLDGKTFQEREEAVRRLVALGSVASTTLERTASDLTVDPDVRLRAARASYAISAVNIEMVRVLGEHTNLNNEPSMRWVRRVALSPDGKCAITAGGDGIRYWDLAAGKQIRLFGEHHNGYWSLAFSADGRQVIAGGDKVYLFDLKTGNIVHAMTGHEQTVWGTLLMADGKRAISGAWDQSIRVWDTATGKSMRSFKNVRGMVRCLAVSPDGKLLAAGHFTAEATPGTIRIWDVDKGTEIRSLPGHNMEVTNLSFSKDGKTLLSSSFDKTVRLWNVADGKEVKRFQGSMNRVECAAFTPDGRRIVACGDETDPHVHLWDVSSGKLLGVSERADGGLLNVVVLPDGRQCLTAGKDGTVRLWRWLR